MKTRNPLETVFRAAPEEAAVAQTGMRVSSQSFPQTWSGNQPLRYDCAYRCRPVSLQQRSVTPCFIYTPVKPSLWTFF